MMLKKAITSSGKKLLKAIKNVSKARLSRKLEQIELERRQIQAQRLEWLKQQQLIQPDFYLQWTWPSHFDDSKVLDEAPVQDICCCCYCCECYYDEMDENQRNENLENEMLH